MGDVADILDEINPRWWRNVKCATLMTVAVGVLFHQQWATLAISEFTHWTMARARANWQPFIEHLMKSFTHLPRVVRSTSGIPPRAR